MTVTSPSIDHPADRGAWDDAADDTLAPGSPASPRPAASDALPALPVALHLRGQLAEVVRRTVEGVLGWQPVDDVTAGLVPPAVRLVDVTATVADATPVVLLVTADDPPAGAAAAALRLRPDAVLAWPAGAAELHDAARRATSAPRTVSAAVTHLRIGGAAGGVGTTTVALAVAGSSAWRGASTLVASGDALLLPAGAPSVEPAALAAPDLLARAAPVAGVPRLAALRTTAPPGHEVAVADPAVETAVVDVGVAADVDVLVLRPDAAGLAALGTCTASTVVVVGEGPAGRGALTTAVAGRRRIDLPSSARVARAALVGRVPSSLPGRFVRQLAPLVPSGRSRTPGPSG